MKAAIVGWIIFNIALSAVNAYFAARNVKASLRNLKLSQEITRDAQENLREMKGYQAVVDEAVAIIRRFGAE